MPNIVFYVVFLMVWIQLFFIMLYFINFTKKHFFTRELDLSARYGAKSWVLITGASSGQGKMYAMEFAARGFSLLLVGSPRIRDTAIEIERKYGQDTRCVVVDFCKAYRPRFFKKIERAIDALPGELSILVNNVGHRVAWKPYHEMPEHLINDSIVCGTIVQARLTQIALRHFMKRKEGDKKSAIVNITSVNGYSNLWFGRQGDVTLPYLSVYEGANAFGYYHSNSIQEEYGKRVDVLNITPGAVLTENTTYLKHAPFAIDAETYSKLLFPFLGNYEGVQTPYWGHDISRILGNFMIIEKHIFGHIGSMITEHFMQAYIDKNMQVNLKK